MTTDTPRTDASLNTHSMINRQKWCDKCGGFVESIYAGNPMFCRCDPKVDHINKLEADVAKLNHQLLKTENDLLQSQDINSFLDAEFRIACKRAEKAEAEVERLRAEVTLYKGYTRGFGILHCAAYGEQHFGKKLLHPEHYDLLEKAGCRMDAYKKATLNPTDK